MIGRDDFGHGAQAGMDPRAVVAGAKCRHDTAIQDLAEAAVGQHSFEAITLEKSYAALARDDEQQEPVVLLGAAELPRVDDAHAVVEQWSPARRSGW